MRHPRRAIASPSKNSVRSFGRVWITARAQFGEETFMQLSWTSDMVKDEAGNYATVGASGKNINFVFGKAAALNVSYTVKNLFTTADPVLTFEAVLHVTVTAPEIELLRGSSLSDDDRAQAVMKIEGMHACRSMHSTCRKPGTSQKMLRQKQRSFMRPRQKGLSSRMRHSIGVPATNCRSWLPPR